MSPKALRLTGRALIKALKKHGFEVSRIKGSHHFIKHNDGRAPSFQCIEANVGSRFALKDFERLRHY
ncbi:MAG: type II toxin-antitoxin system HicA family toxin [Verrucomicrobiota bacterium]